MKILGGWCLARLIDPMAGSLGRRTGRHVRSFAHDGLSDAKMPPSRRMDAQARRVLRGFAQGVGRRHFARLTRTDRARRQSPAIALQVNGRCCYTLRFEGSRGEQRQTQKGRYDDSHGGFEREKKRFRRDVRGSISKTLQVATIRDDRMSTAKRQKRRERDTDEKFSHTRSHHRRRILLVSLEASPNKMPEVRSWPRIGWALSVEGRMGRREREQIRGRDGELQ